jgi:hypothetical protein
MAIHLATGLELSEAEPIATLELVSCGECKREPVREMVPLRTSGCWSPSRKHAAAIPDALERARQ